MKEIVDPGASQRQPGPLPLWFIGLIAINAIVAAVLGVVLIWEHLHAH